MAEWLYKANKSMLDVHGTLLLAEHGFLCRSAYQRRRGGEVALVNNVRRVQLGDTLHFYFSQSGKAPRPLGKHLIIEPGEHEEGGAFGPRVPETALYVLNSENFLKRYDAESRYEVDPHLNKFTGWLLRKLGPNMKAPDKFAKGRATLARVDEDGSLAILEDDDAEVA
ncbi:MAG: hypothetical protein ABUL62_06915 [Myxococcales bacterium]